MRRKLRIGSRTGRWAGIVAGVLVIAGSAGCAGDGSPPAEVLGTWTTEAPEYADRAFTITDSTLTLYQGEGRSVTGQIVSARREARTGWTEVALEYEQSGSRMTFSFQYFQSGEIRLANQEHMVWRRKG